MARKVLGKDYILFMNLGTTGAPEWKPVLCQTSATVNIPTKTIDATSKCGTETLIDTDVESVDFEGQLLQKDLTDTTRMTTKELLDKYRANRNGTTDSYEFKLVPPTTSVDDDGKLMHTFTGRFTNLTITYPMEIATASGSISAIGEMVETEYEHA